MPKNEHSWQSRIEIFTGLIPFAQICPFPSPAIPSVPTISSSILNLSLAPEVDRYTDGVVVSTCHFGGNVHVKKIMDCSVSIRVNNRFRAGAPRKRRRKILCQRAGDIRGETIVYEVSRRG